MMVKPPIASSLSPLRTPLRDPMTLELLSFDIHWQVLCSTRLAYPSGSTVFLFLCREILLSHPCLG